MTIDLGLTHIALPVANIDAVGSWIANKFSRWIPVLWVLSTIGGFIGYFSPGLNLLFVISGIIFGAGFVGAGIEIRSGTRERATVKKTSHT
jgi:hypothetical protein